MKKVKNNAKKDVPKLSNSDIQTIFSNVELFKEIAEDEGIIKLTEGSQVIIIENSNTILMKEGEIGNKTYIMLSGEAEILVKSLSGDKFVVAIMHADMSKKIIPIVGEISLLSTDQKRSATVRVLKESVFLVIENKTFVSIIQEYPHIGLHVYRKMCESLQQRLERSNKNVAALFEAYVDEILPAPQDLEVE